MLVFEGILPVALPQLWRNWMQQMLAQNDRALRVMGLVSMLLGLLLVTIARKFF